jgi:6-phosphogluconolactonase
MISSEQKRTVGTMSAARVIHEFETKESLMDSVAEYIVKIGNSAISQRGRFIVAVSGGSMPQQLGSDRLVNAATDWSRWHVVYADERFVPTDHADSNHAATHTHWLSRVAIPPANVHTMQFDSAEQSVDRAAQLYESVLEGLFAAQGSDGSDDGVVELDLVLLGLGPDGHTASLFPGHPLLAERDRLVAPISDSPKPPPQRITFTFPLINAARNVAFIATGAAKQAPLQQIFESADCALPAALVRPAATPVVWFVDSDAVGWKKPSL